LYLQVEALKAYANKIGLAFQITDDILDATASTKDLGKTAGKDQEQNKFTYVKEHGLKKAGIMALELINKAKEDLATIQNSNKLKALADHVISRQH
jgi:geranylgeranyl pyrophosphate synthase